MYQVTDLARAAKFYRETIGLPQDIYPVKVSVNEPTR